MNQALKNWWQARRAKHYISNHWHLLADIILVLIIISLIVSLIIIKLAKAPIIDTSSVIHIPNEVSTTTGIGSLQFKTESAKNNIYAGQIFNLKITLENNGNDEIKNLELTPDLSNNFSIIKIENVKALSNVKVSGSKLVLNSLLAGEIQEADIWLAIKAKTDSPRSISWSIKAKYEESGSLKNADYKLDDLKLISDLKVKAEAYYNSPLGDQLGSGPIPPIVGLPTNYWVFFEIDNQGNDLSGVSVNAKLSDRVTLANRKTLSAGEFNYDESQKRLSWTIKNAPINNGLYQLGFEVQLMPSSSQLNTSPILVNNISYLATDIYTGEKLGGKISPISTELPLDTINRGQSVVSE